MDSRSRTVSFLHEKVLNFGRSAVARNTSCPAVVIRKCSCFNTMFSFNVCLKFPRGYLIRVLISKYDDFEEYDIFELSDVIDDATNRRAVGTFLYKLPIGHEPLNRL